MENKWKLCGIKKLFDVWGEMAHWIKCFPHKPDDLNSDSQDPCKNPIQNCMHLQYQHTNREMEETETGQYSYAHWPVSLMCEVTGNRTDLIPNKL